MARVIAVQAEQMNMLRENYKKSVPAKSVSMNNADVLNDSLSSPVSIPSVAPIDMETQVVNLDSSVGQPSVTSAEVTNEVFGPQVSNEAVMPVFPGPTLENASVQQPSDGDKKDDVISTVVDVPYKEPNLGGSSPVNVMSDDSYYELLNSLRNMITDFANNAYAAIDKYQEEKLQGKSTGASLISVENNSVVQDSTKDVSAVSPVELNLMGQNNNNIFDNQSNDLDNTVVIPGNVISNAINELESEVKLAA